MGVALFIVLQQNVDGVDASSVGGKFLARNLEMLDSLAASLKTQMLSEFISANPDEVSDFAEGEGVNVSGLSIPPEQWFNAEEGLRTVRALLGHLSAQPGEPRLLEDLLSCERVLTSAAQAGVRFHFALDF